MSSPMEQIKMVGVMGGMVSSLSWMEMVCMSVMWGGVVWGVSKSVVGNMGNKVSEGVWKVMMEMGMGEMMKSEKGKNWVVMVVSVILGMVIMNVMSMMMYNINPMTHMVVTGMMGISVVMTMMWESVKEKGVKVVDMIMPSNMPVMLVPMMVVMEIVSYMASMMSMSLSMTANMVSGHMMCYVMGGVGVEGVMKMSNGEWVGVMGVMVSVVMLVGVMMMEIMVAMMQAYVMTMLMVSYMKEV